MPKKGDRITDTDKPLFPIFGRAFNVLKRKNAVLSIGVDPDDLTPKFLINGKPSRAMNDLAIGLSSMKEAFEFAKENGAAYSARAERSIDTFEDLWQ